jgi:hypothetical protein
MRNRSQRAIRLRSATRVSPLLAALALTSCALFNGSFHARSYPPVSGATVISAPSNYVALWQEMQTCSGLRGNFNDITWFQADSIVLRREHYLGYWFADRNRIVIRADRLNYDNTVKHEMMHALSKLHTHAERFFNGPCGQLDPMPY